MTNTPSLFISGAGAGIGRATAKLFHQRGWRVGAADINQDSLASLLAELGHERCQTFALDVRDHEQWQQVLAEFCQANDGKLDLLFNNAGILCSGPFADTSIEQHQTLVDINVQGVMNGCHAALPYLQATPGSRVVNMSSASTIYGQPDLASYSASKFAVNGLSEALSLEWQSQGIRVMAVAPLFVRTAMIDGMQTQSIKRFGVRLGAEDVARTVWQISQHNGYRVHWPVGSQTKLAYLGSKLSPAWLNRAVNRWANSE
ncbi:SDR family oxidoreductase [Pseudidiomarina halophila]|uniref:Short-chain dehydrogenase n=1 Tax=Pseudidiomarina halophila TaxID=1449799 RepID=A0A432XTJ4_9GAMM|nr:SDR family oxidoreductase [Pseudidiomarina halophila]RUO51954.1 short-chain dehydrogenase [Pseudidiomarina halophila]